MTQHKTLVALLVALALAAGACGSNQGGTSGESNQAGGPKLDEKSNPFGGPIPRTKPYPVFVSSELTVGPNRFLLGLLNNNDAPIGDPSIGVHVNFFDLAKSATKPVFGSDLKFLWAVRNQRGLYVTNTRFKNPGAWGAQVIIKGPKIDVSVKGSFTVKRNSST